MITVRTKSSKEELLSNKQVERLAVFSQAIQSEEETITFYSQIAKEFPDSKQVMEDIIREETKHIGQLQVLRDKLSKKFQQSVADGVDEAEHQIKNKTSEEK